MTMSTETKNGFNPWPPSIIAFFVVAICFTTGIVIYCSRVKVDLVAEDYYEQEVHYQDVLDRSHHAAALPSKASVVYEPATRCIQVKLPTDQAKAGTTGWIQLYRPSAEAMDRKLPLQIDARGAQTIDAANLSDGLWHVRLSWSQGGTEYYFDQKMVIGRKAS
jgi:nitrogen fixation protein FixH